MLTLNPESYEGLIRLAVGFCTFMGLLLLLRSLSIRSSKGQVPTNSQDRWLSLEPLTLEKIVDETSDIKSFVFRRENSQFPKFKPGQFISFQIGENSKVIRSYSISSSAESRGTIQVSVKRVSGGLGSQWFHELKVGARVLAYPPSGNFVESIEGADSVYIAGGVGVTPMLSMISTHIERGSKRFMTLIYGVRSTKDLAFHDKFLVFANRHPTFKYVPIISHDGQNWTGEKGLISFDFVRTHVPRLTQSEFFICGPEPMMNSLVDSMLKNSVQDERIRTEKFVSPANLDAASIPQRNVTIEFEGRELSYSGRLSLLEFFESQNVDIPFSCRSGVCGSCKCRVKGEVTSLSESGLSPGEKSKGFVLTCVSYPKENLSVSKA